MDTASSALLVRLFRLSQICRRLSAAAAVTRSKGFALTASYFLFTRYARPSGQPAAVTALRSVCSRERESNQRESAPGIRVSLRSTPLAPVLFRGSARRAIHGPACLVWHPCQTPLSTALPLLAALALRASLQLLLRCATFRPPDGIRGPRCLDDLWTTEPKSQSKSIAAMGRSYGFVACRAGETRHAFCFSTSDFTDDAKTPHQKAEWNRCGRG